MKLLLINPPHPAIGSRIPREHLPPLGLLSVGGPLLDAGHRVQLIDAELAPMSMGKILAEVKAREPDAVLLGHSGSSSAHPIASRIAQLIRNDPAWHRAHVDRGVSFVRIDGKVHVVVHRRITEIRRPELKCAA